MVQAFFTHVEQLNSYVKYLPSIYNSPKATESTQLAVPYTEAQLAVHLLHMCPVHWQNQYDLNQNTIPQDTRRLLTVLETLRSLVQVPLYPRVPPMETMGDMPSQMEILIRTGSTRTEILLPIRL